MSGQPSESEIAWLQAATDDELKRHALRMHIIMRGHEFRRALSHAREAFQAGQVLSLEQFEERMGAADAADAADVARSESEPRRSASTTN